MRHREIHVDQKEILPLCIRDKDYSDAAVDKAMEYLEHAGSNEEADILAVKFTNLLYNTQSESEFIQKMESLS